MTGKAPHRPTPRPLPTAQEAAVPLDWRSPWWLWQLASFVAGTLCAPAFVLVCSLLAIDARSDHPRFWMALPVLVALGHGLAMLATNQRHHRRPFCSRAALAVHHAGVALPAGAALFLLAGWSSRFLPDLVATVGTGAAQGPDALRAAGLGMALALGYAVLAAVPAGLVHARLAFTRRAAPVPTRPAAPAHGPHHPASTT
ncbi:hypothetical protein PGB34_01385 [Xenophilus arseniciresistens]|uniref:Uncharacterized protein n=1 Tax=Xenophilus arseniciresistens TaxID=1283306 RepID=A0AAE3N3A3_9BURK|nr:hypothetical protein [Xenophilus arseniciresistens]MDA7415005.1 hypothetical protein [Xenophilus arseniciresistens]